MNNITHKSSTLRKATAQATVKVSLPATIMAITEKQVPKGDVFEFGRAAGLLGIKQTSNLIPDCHPLPIEYANIQYTIEELEIQIVVEVHTIYRTGVEVEAMHGASIVALTLYDMLKPIDGDIEIKSIKLLQKSGGKSQFNEKQPNPMKCAVIVCSDSVSSGRKQDYAGKAIINNLHQHDLEVDVYQIIPDEFSLIQAKVKWLAEEKFQLVLFTGGTGLSQRDITPEAISPLLTRPVPGIMEAARQYGQQRMPYAMLSRGIAGFIDSMLVLTLPGSTRGAKETMDALFPYVLHIFKVERGMNHDK